MTEPDRDMDERTALPLDARDALRALLKVKPHEQESDADAPADGRPTDE